MIKRFALFFGVNIAIMVTVTTILSLLGVGNYMNAYGIDYTSLIIFCLVWGMAGSFISLMLSKFMAKTMYGVQIITPTGQYGDLVRRVHTLASRAGIVVMPEVGIYNSPEVNAFATGPSKNNSLVAVSSGLLSKMSSDEVEGVLAHEIAHIANGDMVTMALVQGVVNAFVMFLARVVAFAISSAMSSSDDEKSEGIGGLANYVVVMVLQIVFGILGSIIVAFFSRYREYRADSGGAKLAGKEKMIAALSGLTRTYESLAQGGRSEVRAMQISSKSSLLALFSTHPSLENRINALKRAVQLV
jgi:heat shock protein HtpX